MSIVYHFSTKEAQALWECEFQGQISDGKWENANPADHWKFWCLGESVVDGFVGWTSDGGEHPKKEGYALNSSDLLDIVGDRMLFYVQMIQNGIPLEELRYLSSSYDWNHDNPRSEGVISKYKEMFATYDDFVTHVEDKAKVKTINDIKPYIKECMDMIRTRDPKVKYKPNTGKNLVASGTYSTSSSNYGSRYTPDQKDLKRAEDLYAKRNPISAAESMAVKITDRAKLLRRARAMEIVGNKLYPDKVDDVMQVWRYWVNRVTGDPDSYKY